MGVRGDAYIGGKEGMWSGWNVRNVWCILAIVCDFYPPFSACFEESRLSAASEA